MSTAAPAPQTLGPIVDWAADFVPGGPMRTPEHELYEERGAGAGGLREAANNITDALNIPSPGEAVGNALSAIMPDMPDRWAWRTGTFIIAALLAVIGLVVLVAGTPTGRSAIMASVTKGKSLAADGAKAAK